MLITRNLHKSSEVKSAAHGEERAEQFASRGGLLSSFFKCAAGFTMKTKSTQASLSFKGQATRHTTVKWSMDGFQSR